MPPTQSGSSISDRARTNGAAASADYQQGLFDREVEDRGLERLLDKRAELQHELGEAKKEFKKKDDQVKARLSEFNLEAGEVARVGKYRIEIKPLAGGHREFDVAPSTRTNISLFPVD